MALEEASREFKVTMIDFDGNKTSEIIIAETEAEANDLISSRGNFVTGITLVKNRVSIGKRKKMKVNDLIVFSQQMSTMLKAGINTDKALNLVREKAQNDKLKKLYGKVYEEVQKGEPVSVALEKTKMFPNLYINMIRSGETAGNLSKTLVTLSDYYKKESDKNRKIKSAMIYPIILLVMTVLITLGLVVFVLPGITENFSTEQLPWITKTLMDLSHILIKYWYVFVGLTVGTVVGIGKAIQIDKVKIFIDRVKMDLPIVGKILTVIYSARAANTIASLYEVGASMLVIVDETGGTIGNRYIETLFDDIYIKVSTGEYLSKAMAEAEVFDPMLTSMIETGEEAGDLQEVLTSVAEDFDRDALAATDQLISLLTPIMTIIMGVVVGTIAVAIMLPLMKMGETL